MSTPVHAEEPALAPDNRVTSGIAFTIFAGLSFALSGFLANDLVDGGHPGVIVGFYEGLCGLALVLAINVRQFRGRPQVTRATMFWITLAAAGFATAFACFYTALSRIDFSVCAPILGAVPMVSYVVILFVLRGEEHITPRALLGAMLVVAGVGIIGITN